MLTSVEVSASALRHNLGQFRGLLSDETKLAPVVKSNAYGHGMPEVVEAIRDEVDVLSVVEGAEVIELRALGYTKRVLLMSIVDPEFLSALIEADTELPLYDIEMAERMNEAAESIGKSVKVQVKIDTGAARVGILPDQVEKFFAEVKTLKYVEVVGVWSHFADSEDPECAYTGKQIDLFEKALESTGLQDVERHMACSAAIMLAPPARLDLVRVGLSSYGMWPSEEVRRVMRKESPDFSLQPALTWKTRVIQVKDVPKGALVSYGCTHKTRRDTKMAVLPVGYWDGFDRRLSNTGHVLIGGASCPILGRVCMNLTMVDVTDVENVKLGDEVVLIGQQGDERVTAEDHAGWIGTINYEVTTRINPLIPRILVD